MTKKKLQTAIASKLTKLQELLDQIDEARAIDPNNLETWDSDTLYNLMENLKTILHLLADKKHPHEKDEFGNPLVLEEGLCSLVDNYQSEEEEESD